MWRMSSVSMEAYMLSPRLMNWFKRKAKAGYPVSGLSIEYPASSPCSSTSLQCSGATPVCSLKSFAAPSSPVMALGSARIRRSNPISCLTPNDDSIHIASGSSVNSAKVFGDLELFSSIRSRSDSTKDGSSIESGLVTRWTVSPITCSGSTDVPKS